MLMAGGMYLLSVKNQTLLFGGSSFYKHTEMKSNGASLIWALLPKTDLVHYYELKHPLFSFSDVEIYLKKLISGAWHDGPVAKFSPWTCGDPTWVLTCAPTIPLPIQLPHRAQGKHPLLMSTLFKLHGNSIRDWSVGQYRTQGHILG